MALLLPSLHIKNTNLHHHPLHFNNNPGEKTPKMRNFLLKMPVIIKGISPNPSIWQYRMLIISSQFWP
jgi:hypothetical protein